jgi:hypothetical protein
VAAPVGEPALGPVAFMHRASASENPSAPLGHHTLDSTHISQGVVTVAADAGPWLFEASAFHAREPDEHRWDLETHGLDSYSGRVSFRPSEQWFVQVSHGFLYRPEELQPGNQHRTIASAAWLHERDADFTAVTALYGHTTRTFTDVTALMLEATTGFGRNSVYGRAERLQVETEHLLFPLVVHVPHPGELLHWMTEVTIGGVRNVWSGAGCDVGLGGDLELYAVPPRPPGLPSLVTTHGAHPVSFHVFLRVRPTRSKTSGMRNMTMTEPMGHGGMTRHPE